jgi:hypothetical protein
MNFARWAIQLVAMPVFFALGVVSYLQPSPMCTVPGPYGFLTGMWFMYLVMGVAHSGAWLPLIAKILSKSSAKTSPQLDCCAPQDQRAQASRLAA